MKKPMKPLTIKTDGGAVTLLCKHRGDWPPVHAFLGESFDELRAAKDIDDHKYEQLKVWERTCGLKQMNESKCPTCPLAMIETDGAEVPYVDTTGTRPSRPPFAKSKQNVRRR